MDLIRKVCVVPFSGEENNITQHGSGTDIGEENVAKTKTTNSIRERAQLKMLNLLRVMAKIANINGYDESGRIVDDNGNFIHNTDVAVLLLNAMSPGKLIVGEQEFISLLRKANVSPDLILNENIRYKLSSMQKNNQLTKYEDMPQIIVNKQSPPRQQNKETIKPIVVTKRKYEELGNEEEFGEDKREEKEVIHKKRKREEIDQTDEESKDWFVPHHE